MRAVTWHEYVAQTCLDADLEGSGLPLANPVSKPARRSKTPVMGSANIPKSEIDLLSKLSDWATVLPTHEQWLKVLLNVERPLA